MCIQFAVVILVATAWYFEEERDRERETEGWGMFRSQRYTRANESNRLRPFCKAVPKVVTGPLLMASNEFGGRVAPRTEIRGTGARGRGAAARSRGMTTPRGRLIPKVIVTGQPMTGRSRVLTASCQVGVLGSERVERPMGRRHPRRRRAAGLYGGRNGGSGLEKAKLFDLWHQ